MSEELFLIGPGKDNYGEGWLDPKPKKRIRKAKSKKKLSRQRKWQMNQKKKGLCMICNSPVVNSHYCERHRKLVATRSNKRHYKALSEGELIVLRDKHKQCAAEIHVELKRRKSEHH